MIRKFIKKIIKPVVNDLYHRLNKKEYLGGDHVCPVCENSIKYFLRIPDFYHDELDRYQYVHSPYYSETINPLKYTCPQCKASDRERLYALYFNEKLSGQNNKSVKLLDVAPSKPLAKFLARKGVTYRSADLYNTAVDDKVDVTDMHIYENNRFDIFICSHVLEHVKKDVQAMREFYRILKPGGWGIMMVPILLSLKEDLEDDNITSEGDRWKYYGQQDHVRMYSKNGFVNKLRQAGFKVSQLGIEHFGAALFDKTGVHRRSVLYIVEK